MIILKEIAINNFLSHENTEIKFKPNQKVLLDGRSGSGKSSVIEALIWSLYGKGRADARSLIKRGKKSARVNLTFSDNKKIYKIERIITDKGKHELIVLEGEDIKRLVPIKASGIKNIQEYLEKKILHSSYLLFINSIIYPQDNSESFVRQTAAKKKDIILEMIKADDYDVYYNKILEKKSILQNDVNVLVSTVNLLEEQIKEHQDKANALLSYQDEKIKLEIELKTLEDKQIILNQEMEKIKIADIQYTNKQEEIQKLLLDNSKNEAEIELSKKNLEELEKVITRVSEIKKQIESLPQKESSLSILRQQEKLANEWKEKMMLLLSEAPVSRSFDDEIAEINNQIMSLMKNKYDICPEVQKECPILTSGRDKDINRLSLLLVEKNKEKQEYIRTLMEYENKKKALGDSPLVNYGEIHNLESEIADLKKKEKELIKIDADSENIKKNANNIIKSSGEAIIMVQTALKMAYNDVKNLQSILDTKNEKNNAINENHDLIAITNNRLMECNKQLTALSISDDIITKSKEKLQIVKTEESEKTELLNNLQLLKDAFGQNGIKSILIDYIIPKLEENINNILSKLSDFRVHIDTQKNSVTGESVIEGMFINIFNENGEQFDFDSFSGGEKVKISTAIFEALADIQNFNFRILDESIVSLDEDSTERFIEVMSALQSRVDQIVCVTHLRNIQDMFNEKITIHKINGTSKLIN